MTEDEPEKAEKPIDPKTLRPLKRSDFKEVKRLKKGIARFIRYHRDLIAEPDFAEIETRKAEVDSVLENENSQRADLELAAEKLTRQCEAAVPKFRYSALRENIEVFFVAAVFAMTVRAYFGQPSRIPTASMQPTLNGIIAYPAREMSTSSSADLKAPEGYVYPGFWTRVGHKIWLGRSHVEIVSRQDRDFIDLTNKAMWYEKNAFFLFPRTILKTQNGQEFRVPGTQSRVRELLNDHHIRDNIGAVKKNHVIARGYIDTGDWVIVDRFTYHWRLPKRDDIFVFTTHGIFSQGQGSNGEHQFYIKRLVGQPGDQLEIQEPNLIVNGQIAEEFGIRRVAAKKDGYHGYRQPFPGADYSETVPPGRYAAFGDNSPGSSDSRAWGFVPEKDIVGRAIAVYFPFGPRFGLLR